MSLSIRLREWSKSVPFIKGDHDFDTMLQELTDFEGCHTKALRRAERDRDDWKERAKAAELVAKDARAQLVQQSAYPYHVMRLKNALTTAHNKTASLEAELKRLRSAMKEIRPA